MGRWDQKSMILFHFAVLFFNIGSTNRRNIFRHKKNFFQVLRNMLDTLLKFGGIWLSSFRDLGFTKLKNLKIEVSATLKIDDFHRFLVDLTLKFAILETQDLENYSTKPHQTSGAFQTCSKRLPKSFLAHWVH